MLNPRLEKFIPRLQKKHNYIASIKQSQIGKIHRLILQTLSKGKTLNIGQLADELQITADEVEKHLLVLDQNDIIKYQEGQIKAAYPFATKITRHQLTIDGNTAYALCAIDALGIPFMLKKDAIVKSNCTYCEQPLSINFNKFVPETSLEDISVWIPLVKVINKAVDDICPHMDFFCSAEHALSWQEKIGYDGLVLTLEEAIDFGKFCFSDFI